MSYQLDSTNPIARKEHQCDLCLTAIEKGERYVYCGGFYDGSYHATKLHDWCNDLCGKLTADWDEMDWETCRIADAFQEWIHECYTDWGVDEEMHVHDLLEQLRKWRVRGDERRIEVTCRAILAQLAVYTGNLLDREAILREVQA